MIQTRLCLDPSSTCIGWSLSVAGPEFIDAGIIYPKKKSERDAIKRVDSMLEYFSIADFLKTENVKEVVIETPAKKVHAKLKRGAGLAIYGFAVGRIYQYFKQNFTIVHPVSVDVWTKRKPFHSKAERPFLAERLMPKYKEFRKTDKGFDAADAICLALWWDSYRNMEAAIERSKGN